MDGTSYSHFKTAYFLLLLLGGHIGLPVIILTALLSKSVKRSGHVVNLWITGVVYSVAYSLLSWSGRGQDPNAPPSLLCQVQSAMIHGASPMALIAGLTVVVQIWATFNSPLPEKSEELIKLPKQRRQSISEISVLVLPYIVFTVFTTAAAVVGSQNLNSINSSGNDGLYCTLEMSIFSLYLVPIFCAVVLAILICIAIGLGIRYLVQWRYTSKKFPLAERKLSVSLIIRIMIFNVYAIITFTSSIFLAIDNQSMWRVAFLIQAGVPLIAFIVFGTQKDMINVWGFWRRREPIPNLPLSQFDTKNSTLDLTIPSATYHKHSYSYSTMSFEEFLQVDPHFKIDKR